MKVVHISQGDSGGAGLAVLRLHRALLNEGIESYLLCLNKTSKEKNVVQYTPPLIDRIIRHTNIPYKQNKYNQFLEKFDSNYECASFPEAVYDISEHALLRSADVVNLHWVGSILNYKRFFSSVKQPIVWTFHDMNPFMGIAHYKGDLEKNKIHYLLEEKLRIQKKKAIHRHKNLTVVALNQWMRNLSLDSETFKDYPHHIIYNSVDTSVFRLYDRKKMKDLFDFPDDKPILLFVSQHVANKRKGVDILFEAIRGFSEECYVVMVGIYSSFMNDDKFRHIKTIKDERLLAFLYSAADAFILPSREDNLPNTMLEALCCGTPVITMPNGGMVDVINDAFGVVAKGISVQSLQDAIKAFIDNKDYYYSAEIAEKAKQMFSPSVQAQAYIELYNKIINENT